MKNPTYAQVLDWAWRNRQYLNCDLYVYAVSSDDYAFLIKSKSFYGVVGGDAEGILEELEYSMPRRLVLNQGEVSLAPLGQGLLPRGQFISARPIIQELLMDAWDCESSSAAEILDLVGASYVRTTGWKACDPLVAAKKLAGNELLDAMEEGVCSFLSAQVPGIYASKIDPAMLAVVSLDNAKKIIAASTAMNRRADKSIYRRSR